MVTIITDKGYIQTNKIHSIYMDEQHEDAFFTLGKRQSVVAYNIVVTFEPININNSSSQSRNDNMTVEIKVFGLKRATLLMRDMIKQIREQCPDQLYLDKIAEKFLTGEIEDEPNTSKICSPREKKRRSKKVLRRVKKRNKRSRK